MNWIKPSIHPTGFGGAEVVFISETHLLARWTHSECRGWQVYARCSTRARSQTRWIAGAGDVSLAWESEAAIAWAEQHLHPQP
jgi:hypothetical protein